MIFLVECEFSETVRLGKLFCDSVDLNVEAPTARIAELKVMNCYPDLCRCEAKPVGKETRSPHEGRMLLLRSVGAYAAVFACCFVFYFGLPPTKEVNWKGLVSIGVWSLIVFYIGTVFCSVVESRVLRKQEEIAASEREYCRRLGYRLGWTECERGATPQFKQWVEEDSADIDSYPGPASPSYPHR